MFPTWQKKFSMARVDENAQLNLVLEGRRAIDCMFKRTEEATADVESGPVEITETVGNNEGAACIAYPHILPPRAPSVKHLPLTPYPLPPTLDIRKFSIQNSIQHRRAMW
ncbi:hypothetical protein APHAL10511_003344 [Amanita phalloides]|nr:hypothetical protein APHAL10511_003344 [Amanita phalloides]